MVINTFLVPGISRMISSFLEDAILVTIFKDVERWRRIEKLVATIILEVF